MNPKIVQHLEKIVGRSRELKLPEFVKIVEVGPRDGLQNEKQFVETDKKVELINDLSETGLKHIEVTSMVNPKWIPQFKDNKEVYSRIKMKPDIEYSVLVPNMKGLEQAIEQNVKDISIFTAASDTFNMKNTNCNIEDSIKKYQEVVDNAKEQGMRIRGYVSCVMGCPYEGEVDEQKVGWVTQQLLEMGCYEVSLGDTVGMGTVDKTNRLIQHLQNQQIDMDRLAVHFHDNNHTAIENILQALQYGISVVDSSIGGLGGCPYAKSAKGNVCTEHVLYVLSQLGVRTGLDIQRLSQIGQQLVVLLQKDTQSLI